MPAIEQISIERFPDYVQDMLQNKESKLKPEFMVSFLHKRLSALYSMYILMLFASSRICMHLN